MKAPRFERAVENAADNVRHLVLIIFRVAMVILFLIPAGAAFARGDPFAAVGLAVIGLGLAVVSR